MNTELHDRWIGDHRMSVVLQNGEVEMIVVGNHTIPIEDWKVLTQWVEDARNGYFDAGDNDDE